MDYLILKSVLIAWIVFGILHIIVFRFIKDNQLFPALVITSLVGALPLLWMVHGSLLFLSLMIYFLGVGNYILCVWGPLTTSIRIRLIRELAKATALTRAQINEQYNEEMMLNVRLNRLMGAGDVTLVGDKYQVVSKRNVFFLLKNVSTWLTHKNP